MDGTVGSGGHAGAILAASSPTGWLAGCDQDAAAMEAATRRLAEFAGRFELRHENFSGLADWLEYGLECQKYLGTRWESWAGGGRS